MYIGPKAADPDEVCQYAVVLMGGNAARWMDRLEVQGNALKQLRRIQKAVYKSIHLTR